MSGLAIAVVLASIVGMNVRDDGELALCIAESLAYEFDDKSKETVRMLFSHLHNPTGPAETRSAIAVTLAGLLKKNAPDSLRLEICACMKYLGPQAVVAIPAMQEYAADLKVREIDKRIVGTGPNMHQFVESIVAQIEQRRGLAAKNP